MSKLLMVVILIVFIVCTGCSPSLQPWQKAENSYKNGNLKQAEEILVPMKDKIEDNNYPLNLLSLGSIELNYGDYQKAQLYFQAAISNMEVDISEDEVTKQIFKSETKRLYRGFTHEKALAHIYLGLSHLQMDQFNEARIEFAKARESDISKKDEYTNDFCIGHFLDGMNALYSNDYQNASVSFRKVNELKPEFPLAWYGLYRACTLDNELTEAEEAWSEYESLTNENERLSKTADENVVLLLIDGGYSPDRKPDELIGQFAKWAPSAYQDSLIKIYTEDSKEYSAYPVSDVYYQATTAGGFDEDLKKKVVSVAAKETLKAFVPLAGLFMGKSEADIRSWRIAPGEMHIAVVPVGDSPTSLRLKAYNSKLSELPLYTQTLYYISGKEFEEPNIVYLRIFPNADYREI